MKHARLFYFVITVPLTPLLPYSSSYLYRLLPRRGDGHEKATTTIGNCGQERPLPRKGNAQEGCGQEDICPEKRQQPQEEAATKKQ
jgi:hypothetical protein